MRRDRDISRRLKKATWPIICAATIAYFGYHGVEGEHGVLALLYKSKEVSVLEQQASELRELRENREARTALLQSGRVDPDMLDETSRELLGFVHPNDLIIIE